MQNNNCTAQHNRNQVSFIGSPSCHYDVNRGRLTYHVVGVFRLIGAALAEMVIIILKTGFSELFALRILQRISGIAVDNNQKKSAPSSQREFYK